VDAAQVKAYFEGVAGEWDSMRLAWYQQLEVLDIQTTATANEHSHQRPERDVEEREGRIAEPARTGRQEGATRLLAPFRPPLWGTVALTGRLCCWRRRP
jgi:hypothetical protein